uniref:Uncharacterized protein n=1 Tax=Lotharella globosa TaxID=91324 RepID=A0A7S3YJI1_9EUKA
MWRRSKSPRGRDGQLNKQAALEQFHRFFGFDSSEKVLHVCACGLKSSKNSGGFFSGSKSTIEGILYGSTNHLSFIDPRNKKLQTKLPLENVTAIRPGMDSTSLQVETSERKHYFVDFKDRNESMGRFMEIWTQHQSRAASSAFDDPLSIGANVQVMGQNVKVTGRDAMAAAAFAKRHSDKVKVGLNADGSVNVKINPRGRAASSKKKQAAAPRNDDWQVVSGAPRRYVRMRGHTGLQKNRMGIYVEKPELGSGGYSAYKHITGDWYLYYFKSNKFWFVGSRIGKRSGWLYVQSEEQYPDNISKPWRYFWSLRLVRGLPSLDLDDLMMKVLG